MLDDMHHGYPLEAVPYPALAFSMVSSTILDANRALAAISGYSAAALRDLKLDELVSFIEPPTGDTWPQPRGSLDQPRAQLVRADGSRMPARYNIWPPFECGSDLLSIVIVDIDPPLSATIQRLRNDSRFQALVSSLFDGYQYLDVATGRFEFAKDFESVLGISPEHLRTSVQWFDRAHPDDRARVESSYEGVLRGDDFSEEYRIRRDDGTYALVRDRAVAVRDESGAVVEAVGVIRDITVERQVEQTLGESAQVYRTLFEMGPSPAFQIDGQGNYIDANEAGLAFLATNRERLIGSAVTTDWGDEVAEALRTVLRDDHAVVKLNATTKIDGLEKEAVITLIPCDLHGRHGCFALATDVSDRRALEQSLRETNTALRVIQNQQSQDLEDIKAMVVTNVETMVLPLLDRVRGALRSAPEAAYLHAARQNLEQVVLPIADSLRLNEHVPLTPREREIAILIRAGRTSAEIAGALHLAFSTVTFHRRNLRRKYGLKPNGPRLSTLLGCPRLEDTGGVANQWQDSTTVSLGRLEP